MEIYETLDALMAFDISDAGEHTIEMKYMPSCYIAGAAISVLGILAFMIICIIDFIIKKTLFRKKAHLNVNGFWVLEDFEIEESPFSVLDALQDPKEAEAIEDNISEKDEEATQTDETSESAQDGRSNL